MAIVHEFEYYKPKTFDETVKLLDKYGSEANILAGGTDLIGWLRDDLSRPDAIIDIKGIKGLSKIEFRDDTLFIGPLVNFNTLINSEIIRKKYPLILEMSKTVASHGLRNRATIVGNICSAVPCCDSGPVLLVYNAEVQVRGPAEERNIPVSEWFIGPKKTSLKDGEVVTGLIVPLPKKKHAGCYVKLGRYNGEDLAQASVAILSFADNFHRIAFGAVGPTPIRAKNLEVYLGGKRVTDDIVEEAKEIIPQEISPITDVRATKEYRTHMTKVMFERGIKTAIKRISGKGPSYGTALI